jgi:hypothetical protein
MRRFVSSSAAAGALLLILSSGCDAPGAPGEAEARRLADAALIEYRERERLPTGAFGPPVISAEGRYPWVFDYTSRTHPRHLVRIYVDSSGRVERHRLIE